MNENELRAGFIIYGHEDVAVLTHLLGIKPDTAVNKGEPLREGAAPIPRSMWRVGSGLTQSASLEDHVVAILDVLRPQKERITEISRKYDTVIAISTRYYEPNPGFELQPEVIAELSQLGVRLWIDIYQQSNYWLNSPEKVKKLAQRLTKVDGVGAITEQHKRDEAMSIANALATFESLSDDIEHTLMCYFGYGNTQSDEENLEQMANNLADIIKAARKSSYLSTKLGLNDERKE